MTRTSRSTLADLAAAAAARGPRLLVLSAPVGYGKGAFLRSYASAHVGPIIHCDVPVSGNLARAILDGLTSTDARRAGHSAADRLAQHSESADANAREALRRAWPAGEGRQALSIRDPSAVFATPAGVDLLAELVATQQPGGVVILSTRADLPPALRQIIRAEGAEVIEAADLRLSPEGTLNLARAEGLPDPAGAKVHAVSDGWPLVTRLLLRLAKQGDSVEDVAEVARGLGAGALFAFAAHRTIARLDESVRRAVVVSVLLRSATHPQLVRILGDDCDDLIFTRLTGLPFVTREGPRAIVHPEIASVLQERFPAVVASLFEQTLNALTGDGAYIEAAHVALDRGEAIRAAEIIDAAPPYTTAPVPLAEYERIIEQLDLTLLTRFPNVWIATIPYRSFAVDRATFIREAETVYYCLPPGSSPDQRAAALMLLASAYYNRGRRSEAEQLIEDALQGFARDAISARASLLHFSAWFHGMEGRFASARSLAAKAAEITRVGFGEDQTLHYIDAHEAAYRGQNERVVVIIDELLRRSDDLPLHRANTAANGALFAWANGDESGFLRYVGVLEDALTPGLERGFQPIVDGARGRQVGPPDGYHWGIGHAQAKLFRLGHTSTREEALDAARTAAQYADERGDPYTQLLSHAALYELDPAARAGEATLLQSIAASVESVEMRSAIDNLLRGAPAGILEPFLARRVRREQIAQAEPKLVAQFLCGRVLRDGREVRLSDKEFELLSLLGSARAPMTRHRIGELLWDHLDPEEWSNNLKVTLSRLRGKLGTRDAIVLVDGRYRLSPAIEVDLKHAESVVREPSGGKQLSTTRRAVLTAIVSSFESAPPQRYDRPSWAESLKARVEDVACRAGLLLAEDALARGEVEDAQRFASGVGAVDPLNEAACEITVRALLAGGELDAARREVRRYSTALADELGAAPSAELVELVRNTR